MRFERSRASPENIFTIIMLSALFDNRFPHVFQLFFLFPRSMQHA